eukprot:Nitzschia sp. Nitz4//scaffold1_size375055//193015//194731//NITZ4_000277-RA/size375055-processed-gene-0.440-mRNA-1//-1//CDS//3329541048//9049//frame0
MTSGPQQTSGIVAPHEHDVLSGRGNFVNYHAGNEHFRALVRKHKLEYVKCPKPQKGKFSRMIVDEIKARKPPGRFLKQDAQTKLWYDIGEKKALDKTRQALREGAPEIMKEMTGESGDDTDNEDNARSVQTDALNRGGFPGDMHSFMVNQGLSSPQMTRNSILTSPQLGSPGMMSPGMLLGQMSPDMGQFSSRTPSGRMMGRMVDPSALPGPPLNSFDSMQMTAQQQAAMMMNAQLGNNFSGNMGLPGMMSPQQMQLQNQMNAQQAAMSQMSQQLQQLKSSQSELAEMQMLQSKLQSMRNQNNMTSPQLNNQNNMYPGGNSGHFDPRPLDQMPPPPPVQNSTPRQRNSHSNNDFNQGQGQGSSVPHQQQKPNHVVEALTGGGSGGGGGATRRLPPSGMLKRENSLKMEKVFTGASPASTKKKYDGNGSSAHLSAMSLSIGDMNEEGNLSSVFDSSLRISTAADKHDAAPTKEKLKDRNTSWNQGENMDMSVATLGTGGNMSYATFNDKLQEESYGNLSFSKVFEDPEKNG